MTYDGNAHAATGTANGDGTLVITGSHTDAGTYPDAWTYSGGTDYADASGQVTDTIAKANPTVNVTGYTVPFDGTSHLATGTAKGVKSENLTGLDLSGTTHTNAVTTSDSWTFTDVTGNYNNASGTVTDTITRIAPTLTPTGYSGTCDGSAHQSTVTATGLGDISLGSQSFSHTNAGDTTDSWTYPGGANFTSATGQVTTSIAKATVVPAITSYDDAFDGNAHTATGTAKGVLNEDLSGLLSFNPAQFNAGTYADAWSFAGNTNYSPTSGTMTDVITPIDATVTLTNYSGIYDGKSHSASVQITGLGGLILDQGSISRTNAGSDIATASIPDGNYNAVEVTATIDIAKASAILTPAGYSGAYDGETHSSTIEAVGLDNAVLDSASFSYTDAGTYSDNWTFTDPAGNYADATGSVQTIIAPIDAVISVVSYDKPFDGASHTASVTITGLGGSVLATNSVDRTDAGFDSVSASIKDGNYNAIDGTATINITPIDATVSVVNYGGVYDAKPHTASVTITGVGGAVLATKSVDRTDAGSDSVSASYGDQNYNLAKGTATIDIAKFAPGVTTSDYSGVYDGSDHTASVTITGVGGVTLASDTDSLTNAGLAVPHPRASAATPTTPRPAAPRSSSFTKADLTPVVTGIQSPSMEEPHGHWYGQGRPGRRLSGLLDLSRPTHTATGDVQRHLVVRRQRQLQVFQRDCR